MTKRFFLLTAPQAMESKELVSAILLSATMTVRWDVSKRMHGLQLKRKPTTY